MFIDFDNLFWRCFFLECSQAHTIAERLFFSEVRYVDVSGCWHLRAHSKCEAKKSSCFS